MKSEQEIRNHLYQVVEKSIEEMRQQIEHGDITLDDYKFDEELIALKAEASALRWVLCE